MKSVAKKIGALVLILTMAMGMFLSTDLITAQAAKYDMSVKTQSQLNSALADSTVKKIVVKGATEQVLMIPDGDYTGKTLVVKAVNTTLINNGRFAAVKIKKVDEYSEYSKGNKITVSGKAATINIAKKSKESVITCNKAGATVDLDVKGTVEKIVVAKVATLNVTGKKNAEVSIEVKSGAEKTVVYSDLNVKSDKAIEIIGTKDAVKEPEKTEEEKDETPKEPVVLDPPASEMKFETNKNKIETFKSDELAVDISLLDKDAKPTKGHISASNIKLTVEKVEALSGNVDANTLSKIKTAISNATTYTYSKADSGEDVFRYSMGVAAIGCDIPVNATFKVAVTDPKTSTEYTNGRTFEKTFVVYIPASTTDGPAFSMNCVLANTTLDAASASTNLEVEYVNKYAFATSGHTNPGSVTVAINNITVTGTSDAAKITKIKDDITKAFRCGAEVKNGNKDSYTIPISFDNLSLEFQANVELKVSGFDSTVSTSYPNGMQYIKYGSLTIKPAATPAEKAAAKMETDAGIASVYAGGNLELEVRFIDSDDTLLNRTKTSAKVTVMGVPSRVNSKIIAAVKNAIKITEGTKTGGIYKYTVSVGTLNLTPLAVDDADREAILSGIKVALSVDGKDETVNPAKTYSEYVYITVHP